MKASSQDVRHMNLANYQEYWMIVNSMLRLSTQSGNWLDRLYKHVYIGATMEAQDIERYLVELGTALKNRGVKKSIRMMLIGGAYMVLLEDAPRPTEDIDIFWLEEDAFEEMRDTVSACMLEVARAHTLPHNWFNFLTQIIMMNDIFIPDGTLWKRFGPLHIFIPPREYILALKITAGRPKDLDDCAILLPKTSIHTVEQAQKLLKRYILPSTQEEHAEQIHHALDVLFRGEGKSV